ncbi:hypothetical protein O6H91_09G060600 [Diphasiastrum complanatum]|uniref:Uncharacterized protein n=1 Tax=Diphasiastrum complanatum TaxID=34168 RepID=A0ACC2CPJ9_DIPCM|nr:hypothetical protein O6H91_09G060600 [Diphasiastrum complanatum]
MESETSEFVQGEGAIASHGPTEYQARVLKVNFEGPERKYLVHYIGWHHRWDEWVGANRLRKIAGSDVDKQLNHLDHHVAKKRGRKQKSRISPEMKDGEEADLVLRIPLPGILKKQLVDDWELITQQRKLVKLPRTPNANEVLMKFFEYKKQQEASIGDSTLEIMDGLRSYFNKALPAMLLYKEEREQFEALSENCKENLSSIYGAEHLLRLFVKLPDLLTLAGMEDDSLIELQQKLTEFLKFLQKNYNAFFLSIYGSSIELPNQ